MTSDPPRAAERRGRDLDLCLPFLQTLPITGASLVVIDASRSQTTLAITDPVAARIDRLQFELGEGPQWTAVDSGELIAIPDVADDNSHQDWPVFGIALQTLGVGAVFAVPMRMGAVTVGAVTLFRSTPGDLSQAERTHALAIASAVASTAVHRAIAAAADHHGNAEDSMAPGFRREVHQATGMILVQLDTTATIAYSRLQAYAFATGRTIEQVARDVVAGVIVFEPDPDDAAPRDRNEDPETP